MKSYKDPSHQERAGRAAAAKQAALDQLKARPPVDEAKAAELRAARLARAEADAQAREARRAARDADKAAAATTAAHAKPAEPEPGSVDEAGLKAARDERYAARKNRKKGR
jgi:hypothetical protein